MSNSELIQYTIQLRKEYYRDNQDFLNYKKHREEIKQRLPEYDFTSIDRSLTKMESELLNMKNELHKLPHIPNKNERRIIRQNKAKQKI